MKIWHWIKSWFAYVPTPCPYCEQPDRDVVFGFPSDCRWKNPNPGNGSDPPCLTDNYGTMHG